MQLPLNTHIAGWRTVQDWNNLKSKLMDFNNNTEWLHAYDDFYIARLKHRYLIPIDSIKDKDSYSGEGFSIMALICTLVEFLESAWQGTNYRYRRRTDPPLRPYEYDSSSAIFISFLTLRSPFDSQFDVASADAFYRMVRCGLLHEARTKGKWTIWADNQRNLLFEVTPNEVIIYRNNFLAGLYQFIDQYKIELLSSTDRKEAFIRKFDALCEE